jgi:hypothetical protein
VLRKDFELLLGIPFKASQGIGVYTSGDEVYFESQFQKSRWFYVADKSCVLKRLEMGGKKRNFSIVMHGDPKSPENITITHHTFDMVIDLKKIVKDAAE